MYRQVPAGTVRDSQHWFDVYFTYILPKTKKEETCWKHTNSISLLRICQRGILEKKMTKAVSFVIFFALIFVTSHAQSIIFNPQPLPSFKINDTQSVAASCSYTATIRTSCSSPTYTRDQISLSFGDAYGNQVYAPRLDDPSTGTFERCSVDAYQITGPCLHQACYLYLYRSGYDGWKPESVQVYRYYTEAVTFYYNTHIPNNVWYGFNYCSGTSTSKPVMKWFGHVFQVVFCFLCWKGLFGSM